MRILLIGNGNDKYNGLRHAHFDYRIYNGLVRNNHAVYFFSDRDEVRRASPLGVFRKIGKRRINERLLTIVKNFHPEAVILTHAELIGNDTLDAMRQIIPGIRIAHINVDALFAPHNIQNLHNRRDSVDATFITSGGDALSDFSTALHPYYFIPNITDTSFDSFRAFENETRYDVACFMHNGPKDDQLRFELAMGLKQNIPDLRTCYHAFGGFPSLHGYAYYHALGYSAMGLSLSRSVIDGMESTPRTRYLYSSDRIGHMLGNGLLTFVADNFGLQDLYSDKEVVFFHDLNDLTDKVRYYLANDAARKTIAETGWRKAHTELNELLVMRYVMERLFEQPLSHDYTWPITTH